jgi:hypothetical protein
MIERNRSRNKAEKKIHHEVDHERHPRTDHEKPGKIPRVRSE